MTTAQGLQINLYNWWCPKCRKWISHTDMDLTQRHTDCQTKCQWKDYIIDCFGGGWPCQN